MHVLGGGWQRDDPRFADARAQLGEYFEGKLRAFTVRIDHEGLGGTDFQRRVWAGLERIPYGITISYGELARRIGQPAAVRAVGMANGRNPLSIIVPCHRVIGANGKLTGYGGGMERKQWLLALEKGEPSMTPIPQIPENPLLFRDLCASVRDECHL